MIAQKKKIKLWMEETIANSSWKNFNDLHIDEIEPSLKEKSSWVRGGLECLGNAVSLRNQMKLPYVIILGFDLKSSKKKQHITISKLSILKKSLSWSPPSLYLFKKRSKQFDNFLKNSKEMDLIDDNDFKYRYLESFLKEDKEYRASFFVIG